MSNRRDFEWRCFCISKLCHESPKGVVHLPTAVDNHHTKDVVLKATYADESLPRTLKRSLEHYDEQMERYDRGELPRVQPLRQSPRQAPAQAESPERERDDDDGFDSEEEQAVRGDKRLEEEELLRQFFGEGGTGLGLLGGVPSATARAAFETTLSSVDLDSDDDDSSSADETEAVLLPPPPPLPTNAPLNVPECLQSFVSSSDYHPGDRPSSPPPPPPHLSRAQLLSLELRRVNLDTFATVASFESNAKLHQKYHGVEVLSLYLTDKLLAELSHLEEVTIHQCPNGCLAYTGEHANKDKCDAVRTREIELEELNEKGKKKKRKETYTCNHPRYRPSLSSDPTKRKPYAVYIYYPIVPRMRALFSDPVIAARMNYFSREREAAKAAREDPRGNGEPHTYHDLPHGDHVYSLSKTHPYLFLEPRNSFFCVSTDGAMLSLKKVGDFWVFILTILNIPPEEGRYQKDYQWILAVVPTKLSPVDIESFARPIFDEFARMNVGYWMWDASKSEWFLWRGAWLALLADQMGSVKFSGLNGSRGSLPCWFCLMVAASSNAGGHGRYCPLRTEPFEVKKRNKKTNKTRLVTLNPDRPTYDPRKLPMRTQQQFYDVATRLSEAEDSPAQLKAISAETGYNRITLIHRLPCFRVGAFTPLDIAHIRDELVTPLFWDSWGKLNILSVAQRLWIGDRMDAVAPDLPSLFCDSTPRNIHLKRNTQYKMWEWLAWALWYSIPLLFEAGLPEDHLLLWAQYILIITHILDPIPMTPERLADLSNLVADMAVEYERLFVGEDMTQIHLVTLSLHDLLHLPDAFRMTGNPRHDSQLPAERKIGGVKKYVHQHKLPFINLLIQICTRERMAIVRRLWPEIDEPAKAHRSSTPGRLSAQLETKAWYRNDEFWAEEVRLVQAWAVASGYGAHM
ncbi:hypothetical protein RQP46_010399 [Phenoliferia psychrophenolica]